MRLMLHIFKKDARRLWWLIALSVSCVAALAGLDGARADADPGTAEFVLNLLLPAVWAFLVVLLIHSEAPVGDRQFWITRPYEPRVLVGAKVLALIAFIHLPYFVADCVVVTARGFNPMDHVPALLWKQIWLAVALSLPVALLAVVTRNLVQFVPVAVALLCAAVFLAGAVEPFSAAWGPPQTAHAFIPLLGLAVMSSIILYLQYARRRTALARSVALATLVAAGLVYVFVPSEYVFRAQCGMSGLKMHPQPASAVVALASGPRVQELRSPFPQPVVLLSIPVLVSGLGLAPGTSIGEVDQLALEITDANGKRWVVNPVLGLSIRQGGMKVTSFESSSLELVLDHPVYDRIKGRGVSIRGKVGLTFRHLARALEMPALSASTSVPGLRRCSSAIMYFRGRSESLRILCESPSGMPSETRALLLDASDATSPILRHALSEGRAMMQSRTPIWLSPMHREQTFFQRRDFIQDDVFSHAIVELTPTERTGAMVLSYELHDVDLQKFVWSQ